MQYKEAQDAFLDVINPKDYITLQHTASIYKSLRAALKKPLKMILLYGAPGTGKSMMLHKLYDDLKDKQSILLYNAPMDIETFLPRLSLDLFGESLSSLTDFIELAQKRVDGDAPIVLLDEAQLYEDKLMENIRLISDCRKVRFVISLHKTEKEDLIAKAHFQTRIWESFELTNASQLEIERYIQNKLLQYDLPDLLDVLNKNILNLAYEYTGGNFRNTHMLLYLFLDLLAEENMGTSHLTILDNAAKKCGLEKKEFNKEKTVNKSNNKNYKNYLLAMSMTIVLGVGAYLLIPNKNIETKPLATKKLVTAKKPEEEKNLKDAPISKASAIKKESTATKIEYEPAILKASYSFLDRVPKPKIQKTVEKKRTIIKTPKQTSKVNLSLFSHKQASFSELQSLLKKYAQNNNYIIATHIADIYFQNNDFKSAYDYAIKANNLDPSAQKSWLITAKSLFKMDRKDDAIRVLKSYLSSYKSEEIKTLLFKMLSGDYK